MTASDLHSHTFTFKDTELNFFIFQWDRSLLLYLTDNPHSAELNGLVMANAGGITELCSDSGDSSLSDSIARKLTMRFKVPVLVGCAISNEALQKHQDLVSFIHTSAFEAINREISNKSEALK
jgi:hypothetical protein